MPGQRATSMQQARFFRNYIIGDKGEEPFIIIQYWTESESTGSQVI